MNDKVIINQIIQKYNYEHLHHKKYPNNQIWAHKIKYQYMYISSNKILQHSDEEHTKSKLNLNEHSYARRIFIVETLKLEYLNWSQYSLEPKIKPQNRERDNLYEGGNSRWLKALHITS